MKPTDLKYRFEAAGMVDLDDIVSIEEASFPYPWTEGMFVAELSNPPFSSSFVARDAAKRRMVGYVFMRELLDELHLLNIAVHPDYRKRGIGAGLIRCVLSRGLEKGMKKVILEVRVSNEPALGLYRKFGFKQVCIRRNYYCQPTEHAYLLQYDIGAPAPLKASVSILK